MSSWCLGCLFWGVTTKSWGLKRAGIWGGALLAANLCGVAQAADLTPFTFRAVALTNRVFLRWSDPHASGFGCQSVMIRVSTDAYPDTVSDGTEIYKGTNTAFLFDHTNLPAGVTQYYIIFTSHDGVTFVNPVCPDRIVILVEASDYEDLEPYLDRYIHDVQQRFNVVMFVHADHFTSAEHVRETLQSMYDGQGINGAILVGYLPYALWYNDQQQIPMFYEDLDGEIVDIGHMPGTMPDDGIYDYYQPSREKKDPLEIWISLIRPQRNENNPLYTIKRFFDKTHDYYSGNLIYPKRGLIHVHSAYPGAVNTNSPYYKSLYNVYGTNLLTDGPFDVPGEFEEKLLLHLSQGYEIVTAWSHGGCGSHGVQTSEIQGLPSPRSLITLTWSCSSAAFPGCDNNLAIGYVMGNSDDGSGNEAYSDGQVFIGVNRPIGTEDHYIVFDELAKGEYVGEAYKAWKDYMYSIGRIPYYWDTYHFWDFVLIGNPFIALNDVIIDAFEPCLVYVDNEEPLELIPFQMTGQAFENNARVRLNNVQNLSEEYICDVLSISDNQITGNLPGNLPVGVYHITVSNPDGTSASLVHSFRVEEDRMSQRFRDSPESQGHVSRYSEE